MNNAHERGVGTALRDIAEGLPEMISYADDYVSVRVSARRSLGFSRSLKILSAGRRMISSRYR
ncbi:hypothetical protein [Paraburkholderia acidipaludis]|uniref:hypothetical protein n=1 Tax=Paraburkholderia acidipaludis TaxID=660537 RepID=UPI001C3F2C1F|nr:hypothetical protein [Paraburkholderia acidipaludis]